MPWCGSGSGGSSPRHVDEDGRGYATMLRARGAQAAALRDQSAASRQATRQALAAARARLAAR
ncbi:hypothetical protein [Microbispora sp. NPDC049125]|uniref:hypothetical protein n=1 Tax=Microbispora sp. NPDC049125 TaxID=3154929 RepID=UPI00346756F2